MPDAGQVWTLLVPQLMLVRILFASFPTTDEVQKDQALNFLRSFSYVRWVEITSPTKKDLPIAEKDRVLRIDKTSGLRFDVAFTEEEVKQLATGGFPQLCIESRFIQLGTEVSATKSIPIDETSRSASLTLERRGDGVSAHSVDVRKGRCEQPGEILASKSVQLTTTNYGPKLSFRETVLLLGRTRLRTAKWETLRPGVNLFFADEMRGGGFWAWLPTHVGVNVSYVDVNKEKDEEVSVGVVIDLYSRIVFVGFGVLAGSDVAHWQHFFIGISGSGLIEELTKPRGKTGKK